MKSVTIDPKEITRAIGMTRSNREALERARTIRNLIDAGASTQELIPHVEGLTAAAMSATRLGEGTHLALVRLYEGCQDLHRQIRNLEAAGLARLDDLNRILNQLTA